MLQTTRTNASYELVTTVEQLDAWVEKIKAHRLVAIDTETDSVDAQQANLAGISLCVTPGEACYIPVGHSNTTQLDLSLVLNKLGPLLRNPLITKVLQNAKYDMGVLNRYGIWPIRAVEDTMLMCYVMNGGRHRMGMDELASRYLGYTTIKFSEVCGSGTNQILFKDAEMSVALKYAAEDADITMQLFRLFDVELSGDRLAQRIYRKIEQPLIGVIQDMEATGICTNVDHLAQLEQRFQYRLDALLEEMYALTKQEFNPGSPLQLGAVFNSMNIHTGHTTSSGNMSTGKDVLKKVVNNPALSEDQVRLIKLVQEWRQLAKLNSTYCGPNALPSRVNPFTGRVHTSFGMAVTATGRLSSSEPNLQNIPIRTTEGKEIREAFVARPGYKIVAADYSQVELRLVAYAAQDKAMLSAFANNQDIHQMTAAKIKGKPVEDVSKDERRDAKAVNFGIIYGISEYGLARQLEIQPREAQEIIDAYFVSFPGIKKYMEAAVSMAKKYGYVRTLLGRKVWFPKIHSHNPGEASHAERAAVNAPIQGTAADVIKQAMIRMDQVIRWKRWHDKEAPSWHERGVRMLLQVHDELLFEVPEEYAEEFARVARANMQQVSKEVVGFRLPVDANFGDNWEQAH